MASSDRPVALLNTASGTSGKIDDSVLERLRAEAEVRETTDPSQIPHLAARAFEEGRRVIAIGGDGTVHAVLNGAAAQLERCELAVLPAGSGNDFARSLGVPVDDLNAAVDLAIHGSARPCDVVQASHGGMTRLFVNMCYAGFGPRIADQTNPDEKARWGLLPNWLRAAQQMLQTPEHQISLKTPTGEGVFRLHGILAANSCYLGGGVPAAPHARLNDGALDVMLVVVQSVWERFVTSVEFLSGWLNESDRSLSFSTRELTLSATPAWDYTMDGEAVFTAGEAESIDVSLRVLPGAIRVVTSGDAPAFAPAQ